MKFNLIFEQLMNQLNKNLINIIPIDKENENHLKLICNGCNLDALASGDELWSLQDVKDVINKNIKQFFFNIL